MRRTLATTAAATLLAAGCSSSSTPAPTGVDAPPATPLTLRLGFVTSLTQAPALIGIQDGFFAKNLGPSIALRPIPFRTDTAEETALAAGKLDAAYASPTTILNVIQAAHASHIKIVSGAASGGAELVVKPSITTPAQLKGGTLAVPAPGGTQDIALRYWLRLHHLATTITAGGSEVSITAGTPGTTTVSDFTTGHITGAWETAPYDVEMTSHGGRVLVNEASLWPSGQFATTNLVVTQSFLAHHSPAVLALLHGQIQANDYLHQNPVTVQPAINSALTHLTGASLPPPVLAASLTQITYTNDPIATSLTTDVQHAATAGLPHPATNLTSLYDLTPLNLLLRAAGDPALMTRITRLTGSGAQVRTTQHLPPVLLICDQQAALILRQPTDPGQGGLRVRDPAMVASLGAMFATAWDAATPLSALPGARDAEATELTAGERALLRLLAAGLTDESAARQLGISARTVRRQMAALMIKLGAASRFQAGHKAAERGWLSDTGPDV